MITVKMSFKPIFKTAVVRETHSFIKIMQPFSTNHKWNQTDKDH